MSGISVIDFCCGRTQHDTCRQCGRDFNKVAPIPPDVVKRLEALPLGIEPHELPEFRAYQAGLRHGAAIGAGALAVLVAIASFVWGALQ